MLLSRQDLSAMGKKHDELEMMEGGGRDGNMADETRNV